MKNNGLKKQQHGYLINTCCHGGSLEITLTVPFKIDFQIISSSFVQGVPRNMTLN